MAIFWTLYNVTLMLVVLRLGTRPPEKRDGSRFHANFAVEARGEGRGAGVVGVTADISDGGCALLWPAPLGRGTRLPVRINFGPQSADWTAEVASDQGRQADGWYRYGIQFLDLSQADRDLIHDSIFSLVVPELFAHLSTPSRAERVWHWTQRMSQPWRRTRARRVYVRVPVRVDAPGGSFVVAARDVSATGVSLAAPRAVVPGTEVGLSILGPERAWRGHVVVARCEPRPSRPGFDTWLLGLKFLGAAAPAGVEAFYDESAA